MRHPTRDCVDFMRDTLGEDLEDLHYNAPVYAEWKTATADAEVSFPSKENIASENWGAWHGAVIGQVENANKRQIDTYFHEKHPSTPCQVCGARQR